MVTPRNAVAFVIIHPQVLNRETVKIILVSPASILVAPSLFPAICFVLFSQDKTEESTGSDDVKILQDDGNSFSYIP